jgi:nucleoside diphosphate kinase
MAQRTNKLHYKKNCGKTVFNAIISYLCTPFLAVNVLKGSIYCGFARNYKKLVRWMSG